MRSGLGVEGAFDGEPAAVEDMGVDHGGLDVLVPEELLDRAYIIAVLQQVCGEGVTKGVGRDELIDSRCSASLADSFLQDAGVGVVTHGLLGDRVGRKRKGREEVLPFPFPSRTRILASKGRGKIDFSIACLDVFLVQQLHLAQVKLKIRDEGFRQNGGTVIFALTVTDDDLAVPKVNILDSQAQAFHEPQAATIQDPGHQLGEPFHFLNDGYGFRMGQYGGECFRFFGTDQV